LGKTISDLARISTPTPQVEKVPIIVKLPFTTYLHQIITIDGRGLGDGLDQGRTAGLGKAAKTPEG
jgi:hypothetical protein